MNKQTQAEYAHDQLKKHGYPCTDGGACKYLIKTHNYKPETLRGKTVEQLYSMIWEYEHQPF